MVNFLPVKFSTKSCLKNPNFKISKIPSNISMQNLILDRLCKVSSKSVKNCKRDMPHQFEKCRFEINAIKVLKIVSLTRLNVSGGLGMTTLKYTPQRTF